MYPNLYYAFRDIFGVEWNKLRFINSFGFFVAIAFLLAAFVLVKELKRKERAGLLQGTDVKITVGKPATMADLFLNFALGFLLGYKFIGLFLADHRQLFVDDARREKLIGCLDAFMEAGWPAARRLLYRLPELLQ